MLQIQNHVNRREIIAHVPFLDQLVFSLSTNIIITTFQKDYL